MAQREYAPKSGLYNIDSRGSDKLLEFQDPNVSAYIRDCRSTEARQELIGKIVAYSKGQRVTYNSTTKGLLEALIESEYPFNTIMIIAFGADEGKTFTKGQLKEAASIPRRLPSQN